jgi:TrmH family RNA methyltransferase
MLTSFSNPLIKRIKRLQRKKHRQQEGVFYAEGLRVVLAAVAAGAPIETIVYSSELLTSRRAWRMLTEQQAAGTACVEIAAKLFQSISSRDNPVGLGAIIAEQWTPLEELAARPDDIFVALVNVSDPGNLGTVLRTADAAGAGGVILAGQSVDPYHPTAVKASMGSLFHVPMALASDVEMLLSWASSRGISSLATSAGAKRSYKEAEYRFPLLLLLGSEGEGLPAAAIDAADQAVAIPMGGSASSLNLAVAAGILLYELSTELSTDLSALKPNSQALP